MLINNSIANITNTALLIKILLPDSILKSIEFETPMNMDINRTITAALNRLKYFEKNSDKKGMDQ